MRRVIGRRLHVSWLLAWFSAALIGGIALAFWISNVFFTGWQVLVAVAVLLGIVFMKRTVAVVAISIVAGLLLGLWRGSLEQLALSQYDSFLGHTVQLSGTVADDITHKGGESGLKLRDVRINNTPLSGEVWAGASSAPNLKRYDSVTLTGKLQSGFGTFAASMSHATLTRAMRMSNSDLPRTVRDSFNNGLRRAVPQPEAELGIGYLTGQHNNLPDTLTKQLQLIGLIHLVIAGGYNVTILVRFARRGLGRISKYLAMLGACSILFGLTLIAGFTAPMARTAVVTGISLAAWYYGRRLHPLVLLPISAAITAIIAPAFVWGDVGWYLTFIAYGGLIVLGPMIKKLLWKRKSHGVLKQIFVDTLAVQIVTMPLMAFAFQQYSIYGLLANLLVLPLMPITMLAAAVAGVGGMILPLAAARVVAWPATVLLSYTHNITVWLAQARFADAGASFAAAGLIFMYGAIVVVIYGLWHKTRYNFRSENIIE